MPARPVATMESVAQAAGVSRSTVSRALRNDQRLTPETRERVQAIAARLGYRPNPFVTALMADLKRKRQPRTTSNLAFVTAFESPQEWRRRNPSYIDYFEGAKERAAGAGFVLEPFWLGETGRNAERFNRMLYTRSIRGLILPPLPQPRGTLPLDWSRFSAVAIGYTLEAPDPPRAVTNFYQSMTLALEHVVRRGYRRIGFVTEASTNIRAQHAWLAGYLLFQQTLPQARRLPALMVEDAPELAAAALGKWIRATRPDAIVGAHNGVLQWMQAIGFTAPRDIAFASLNTGRAKGDPAGIVQQSRLVGATAIDMLIGQLHRNEFGPALQPSITLIPGRWIDGPTLHAPGASSS